MSTMEWLHHAQEWVVWATLPAAIGFPIWYQLRIRWYHSPVGQHIMGYSLVVALLYMTALLQYAHLSPLFLLWVGLVISVLMGIVVWWRVIIFMWIYRHSRRHRVNAQMEVD